MSLGKEEVEKIADLGRLSLSETEVEKLGGDLNKILDYVATLQELDTKDVEPLVGAVELNNVLRADEVKQTPAQERQAMLNNAPSSEDTFVKVPQMAKKK